MMIDSIDFIINGINYIDFKYLRSKGIEIKSYMRKRNFKTYVFEYKNIKFDFTPIRRYLILETHVNEIIEKDIVTISDKEIYKDRVLKIVKEVITNFDSMKFGFEINRIDYKVDLQFKEEEKVQAYNDILTHYKKNFCYAKQKEQYDTSTYLTNKDGQIHINFYDKYAESNKEEYKNVLRLEIQHNHKFIKAQTIKDYNSREKIIDEYWNEKSMEEFYFKKLREYVYLGTHYKRRKVNELINNSKYNNNYKEKLKKFVLITNRYNITYVQKNIYCRHTVNKYIEMLEKIGINPITIPDGSKYEKLPSLYIIAKQKAENEYYA